MLEKALAISLQILAIYVLFQQGNLLGFVKVWLANVLDKYFRKKISIYIQKPLWECFTCMSSFWTIVLTQSFNIELMLCVCGLNFIIESIIDVDGS